MSVLGHKRTRPQDQIEHDIRHELAEILPILRIEDCAIELDGFDPATGTAILHVTGGCQDCEASAVTFMQGIEVQLKRRIAELKSVVVNVDSTT
ncbi:MAG TPA: NifU family protein [Gemmatimonadaceae bacterium]|nr:NifU family protein [Gemmatimonadaceae bacterium]